MTNAFGIRSEMPLSMVDRVERATVAADSRGIQTTNARRIIAKAGAGRWSSVVAAG
jgi:hypothetical protein